MQKLIDRQRVLDDTAYRNEMRLRVQTELLFCGRVLGYRKLDDEVHGPVEQLCVRKNPALPIEEQSSIKTRYHFDPRLTYKSTLSIIDSTQWITCFPDIRICKATATKPLAKAIVGEITDHFVCPKKPKDVEKPYDDDFIKFASDFQLLFPEFVITPTEKLVGEYTAPYRTRNWREATVMAFSIETAISGWHFDVFDPDDVVETQNAKTASGLENVKKNYFTNRKTLESYGYVNGKGTRYNPFDLWGKCMVDAEYNPLTGECGDPTTKVLKRGALTLLSGKRLEADKPFPAAEEMKLHFPKILPYDFLKREFKSDYPTFMTQYMNDAQGGNEVTFTPEMLMAATVPEDAVPIAA
jgi:hypothetical protein